MTDPGPDPYFVTIDRTLVGTRPGASAQERADRLEREAPVRSFMARVLRRHTDQRAWSKGALGERLVGSQLAKLPSDRWLVLHDIPIGDRGANVDHLVIGPGGVFSLNAKNHKGRKVWVGERALLVNGQKTDHLWKAHKEAARVARVLTGAVGIEVSVRGVVVIMADEITVKQPPIDVDVVARRNIKRWLCDRPASLSRGEVLRIGGAAMRPETWTGQTHS
jgi:hypothetical protein